MTDPVAELLDVFVPAFESPEGDWETVLETAAPARRARRRWRPILVAAVAMAVLAGAGVAIAGGLGALGGIGAADHPQTGADAIDPATAAFLEGRNCGPGLAHPVCQPIPLGLRLDTARQVGQLPDGQNVYVITGSYDDLCTLVEPPNPEIECNSPLSPSHPSTIFGYDTGNNDPAIPWVTFGVALDGVTSVTFQAGDPRSGPEVTVPVDDNLWTYQGQQPTNVLQPLTAHFADGTTVVEPATGQNCAAC